MSLRWGKGKIIRQFSQNHYNFKTRNITEGDEYPQLVLDNIHMYEKFKGPQLI